MQKYLLVLVATLAVTILPLFGQDENPTHPELAKALIAMRKPDQVLRGKYIKLLQKGKEDTKRFERITTRLIATDQQNTMRMRAIVAQYGWPTYNMVGKRASSAAWILVQHADRQPLFQAECLPLLKAAVDEEQASAWNYAYLYDRVQLAFGNPQLYATQTSKNEFTNTGFFQPIEKESEVQNRREAMGIDQHIVDYAAQNGFTYTVPSKAEAQHRADSIAQYYTENVQLARAAMAKKEYLEAVDYYLRASYCDGHTEAADYFELARAISLGDHPHKSWATYFLRKAALRGHEARADYDNNPDLQNIKIAQASNWAELLATINALQAEKE